MQRNEPPCSSKISCFFFFNLKIIIKMPSLHSTHASLLLPLMNEFVSIILIYKTLWKVIYSPLFLPHRADFARNLHGEFCILVRPGRWSSSPVCVTCTKINNKSGIHRGVSTELKESYPTMCTQLNISVYIQWSKGPPRMQQWNLWNKPPCIFDILGKNVVCIIIID